MTGGAEVRRSAVIVGRQNERALLARVLQTAADGGAGAVLLVGEGGVGKTRLLADAMATARASGLAVLAGRASITAPHPFGAVTEALRSWLREHPRGATGTTYDRGLQLVLPEWPGRPAADAPPHLTEAQLRLLALEAVVRIVRDIAADSGGAAFVLDDLHAVDADTVEAVRYLTAALPPGVAVLVGLRPGEHPLADELVRTLQRDGTATVLPVRPLDADAVSELVTEIAAAPPPQALVDDLMHRTDGVPLLVEELIAAHVHAGSVDVTDGAMLWRGDAVPVPSTVRDLVAARLDRLAADERAFIVAAAVLGDFTPDVLEAMSGTGDVDAAVTAGVRVGLLERTGGAVAFRHAIVREAVLTTAGQLAVRRLHRAAAQALAMLARDDEQTRERRAAHLAAAGDDDAVAVLLTAAAHRRVHTHALLTGEALARDAVRIARDPATRSHATDALVRSLAAQGRWNEALTADTTAASEHGDTAERRHRMAMNALEAGRPALAASLVERARAAGDRSPILELAAGRVALVGGDGDAALRHAEDVLRDVDSDLGEQLAAQELRGRAYDFLGRREEAEAAWTAQEEQARAAGLVQSQLRALVQLGKVELFAGRPVRRLQEAVDIAREAGALVELAWAQENLSIAFALGGDLAASAAVLDDAIPRCRALRLDQLGYLLVGRGALESYRGDGDAYRRWLDEADALSPTDDMRLHTTSLRGDVAMRDGRYDEAAAHQAESLRIMRSMPGIVPLDSVCYYVWSLTAAGRDDEARAALAAVRALPGLERWHTRPLLLDAAEALLDRDEDRVEDILSAATTMSTMDRGLTRQLAADILRGRAHHRWLREAHDIFAAAGATRAAERVRQMLRAAGAPVPRARRAAPKVPERLAKQGVTGREAEVLRLVADGLTNSDIAERLVVSVRTVESHVSALLTKLGVARRGQLAAAAREHLV